MHTLFAAALALALLLSGGWTTARAASPEEIKQICETAEKRYQKIFGAPSSKSDAVIVKMYKYTFCPANVTVKQGTTVRWINVDKRTSHSVWFKKEGKEETSRVFPKDKVEMKFDLPPGDYPYLCGPHWESDGMIGKVTVTK